MGSSSIGSSLSSQVFGTTSSHGRLIKWNNSSVRVSNQMCVQVEWAVVAIASSVWVSRGRNSQRASNSRGSNSQRGRSNGCSHTTEFGSQMFSTGSSHSRLINGSDSPVRVTHEAEETLSHGEGESCSKDQELHVGLSCVLELKLPM